LNPPTTRAILIVLDSLGVGELPDAGAYGDGGSDTLGNISRHVSLQIPALRTLGLAAVGNVHGVEPESAPQACYGRMAERSPGKDSVTGHWELTGLVLDRPFPVFAAGFPADLIAEFERRIGRRTLGNVAASGTKIIEDLGPEHVRTGFPIVYTSADSVFQIAAHEEVIAVDELYRYCRIAYGLVVDGLGLGRVIARPFVGKPGSYRRTPNRHDFAMPPIRPTLLDRAKSAGIPVVAVGKIQDLFAGQGITQAFHTASDDEGVDEVERLMGEIPSGLIFANLVDFDTQYGHRNDVVGYAKNLERFDARLSELLPRLSPNDLFIITADHGNDPTTPSTDHSREYVPLLVTGPRVRRGVDLGVRPTFADLGQTLAEFFGLPALESGTSFLADVWLDAGAAVQRGA
jgi:phosphopentomutase